LMIYFWTTYYRTSSHPIQQ